MTPLIRSCAREVLGLDDDRIHDRVFMQQLLNRYLARQMAGMCQYQLVFDRDTSERSMVAYQQIMSEALCVRLHGSGYALNVDGELYAVGYFYADLLIAQIRRPWAGGTRHTSTCVKPRGPRRRN